MWTSEAWNDVFAFLARSFGVVFVAMVLYSLGPTFGMTLIGVGLLVWSFPKNQTASTEEEGGHEDDRHEATVKSPLDFAKPAWLRNSGTSSVPTDRPVVRHGT